MTTGQDKFAAATNVSRETLRRLEIYADLLMRWNPRINLVAGATLPDLWTRHFLDSAQVYDLAPRWSHWVDLGSGGGFPGVVVAILAADGGLSQKVTLVEADQRKATFLRTVLRETNAPGHVLVDRIEALPSLDADILSARALAPLKKLLAFGACHLHADGRAFFHKGQKVDEELTSALEDWRFDCKKHPSATESGATILSIGDIRRV